MIRYRGILSTIIADARNSHVCSSIAFASLVRNNLAAYASRSTTTTTADPRRFPLPKIVQIQWTRGTPKHQTQAAVQRAIAAECDGSFYGRMDFRQIRHQNATRA